MKITITGLCALLLLPVAALAGTTSPYSSNETATASASLLTGKLTDLQKGKTVSVADLQTAAGDTQSLPQNGEATLSPKFNVVTHTIPMSGSAYFSHTDTNFEIHVKIVNGQITGMVATESLTTYSIFPNTEESNPQSSTTNFSFGDPDFVKKYQSTASTGAGSQFIPSQTTTQKTALGTQPSPLQEQKCGSTVSPSTPGCAN